MRIPYFLFLALALSSLQLSCAWAPGVHFSEDEFRKTGDMPPQPRFDVRPITMDLLVEQKEKRAEERVEAQDRTKLEQQIEDYQYNIGPRDILTVTVWDHPELTIPAGAERSAEEQGYRVNRHGDIFFPYVGEVQVAGKTLDEVRSLLTEKLSAYIRDPQLDVRVAGFRSKGVYLSGEIRRRSTVVGGQGGRGGQGGTGQIPITDQPLTLMQAVTEAGLEDSADLRHVYLIRDGKQQVVNVRSIFDDAAVGNDVLLEDGDIIHVPDEQRRNKVFVLGETRQGVRPMNDGELSLADTLGESGGIRQLFADASRIFVLRGDGTPENSEVFRLNANRPDALMLSTQFEMEPLDIVFVSTSGVTRWNRVISQITPTINFVNLVDTLNANEVLQGELPPGESGGGL